MAKRDSESALIRSIMGALKLKGYWVLRLNAGLTIVGDGGKRRAIRGVEPGTPDLLVIDGPEWSYGHVEWLEVKTPKGRVSNTQRGWHDRATHAGHEVHVVRSVEEALEAVS